MSLLQDPVNAIEQIDWYLDNRSLEKLPGAFVLAAGNLARQLLEQILFLLAFHSGMPDNKYLKGGTRLRTADEIFKSLQEIEPTSGKPYIELARRKSQRIRKFAKHPKALDNWRRKLNESSHYSVPLAKRKLQEKDVRRLTGYFRPIFDEADAYLITAAVNQIGSNGYFRAVLGSEPDNIPGIECDVIVKPNQIEFKDGQFSLRTGMIPIQVVPADQEVPYRWKKRVVLVQHTEGVNISGCFVTRNGNPVDLSNFQTVLETFASDPKDRRELVSHMKKLGFTVDVVEESTR